jgi:hypothetical protein
MRRITALTVGRPIAGEDYERAAAVLRSVADDLEAAAQPGKRTRGTPESAGHPQDYFPGSPVIGYANPLAPPVDLWPVDGVDGLRELRGRAWFDYQYEGPPTCVHGGVIAQLFDELLGSINILNGQGGFTGTLTVRYRRPTPLRSVLDLEARQTGRERRKIFASGAIYHDGELTAEADGVFIEVRPETIARIVTTNAVTADGEVVEHEWAELAAALPEAALPEAALPGAALPEGALPEAALTAPPAPDARPAQTARSRPTQ